MAYARNLSYKQFRDEAPTSLMGWNEAGNPALRANVAFKGKWDWSAHSDTPPVAGLALEAWVTVGELADPYIPDGSLLIAKIDGASVVDANPDTSEFWIQSA
jgi:hypothetical protein